MSGDRLMPSPLLGGVVLGTWDVWSRERGTRRERDLEPAPNAGTAGIELLEEDEEEEEAEGTNAGAVDGRLRSLGRCSNGSMAMLEPSTGVEYETADGGRAVEPDAMDDERERTVADKSAPESGKSMGYLNRGQSAKLESARRVEADW